MTEILMILVFALGYLLIVLEHPFKIDKTASALIMGVLSWTIYILNAHDIHFVSEQFMHHLAEISSIVFFLLGAMTIVEIIDIHDGFHVIVSKITTNSKRKLLWILCIVTFFLSAILDNLTTAIVMGSLLTKLVKDKEERLIFGGMIIIAANSGGAWSPIGDVTTTMLWIKGQISILPTIKRVFLPSLVSMLVPLSVLSFRLKGEIEKVVLNNKLKTTSFERVTVLVLGIGLLLFVPVFKTVTHLPPFAGMFLSVGILWLVTDLIHFRKLPDEKTPLSVFTALSRVDTANVLFFFGILATIAGLESFGSLGKAAHALDTIFGNIDVIVFVIGVVSAVVDNVPLVAAAQGMYPLAEFPKDHHLWQFIAYCAGTGGSMLIIGSAAGVAIMGILKINFIWYLKNIGWLAALGYIAGAAVYLLDFYLL